MAMALPVVAAIGGGSTVAGGIILASTVASIGAGVMSAKAAREQGKVAQKQAEINAAAEGDSAREREIQRKKALIRSVSARRAVAGAGGISFDEGSQAALTRLDADEANRDLIVDRANTRQRQSALRSQGRAARYAGNLRSATTLLDTASYAGKTLAPAFK